MDNKTVVYYEIHVCPLADVEVMVAWFQKPEDLARIFIEEGVNQSYAQNVIENLAEDLPTNHKSPEKFAPDDYQPEAGFSTHLGRRRRDLVALLFSPCNNSPNTFAHESYHACRGILEEWWGIEINEETEEIMARFVGNMTGLVHNVYQNYVVSPEYEVHAAGLKERFDYIENRTPNEPS